MAERRTHVCDGCGVLKGKANHWWVLVVERDGMHVYTWYQCHQAGARHYCGERCLTKAISERLQRGASVQSFAADSVTA